MCDGESCNGRWTSVRSDALLGGRLIPFGIYWCGRLTTKPARDAAVAPNLHVPDFDALRFIGPPQVQPQFSSRVIKLVYDMQRLDLNSFLEISKELLDVGEGRAWNKLAQDEVIFMAFYHNLANLSLLGINQINYLLDVWLHVYNPVVFRKVAANVSRFSSVNPATPLG